MMRVFGHHIAVPVLLLAALEAGVLIALFEGLTTLFGHWWPGPAPAADGASLSTPLFWGDHMAPRLLAILGIVVIAAVGMYSRRMFFDIKTFVRRSLVIFPLLFVATAGASVAYAMYMGTDWSGFVILAGFATPAAAVALLMIRYFFVELADLDVFKRRILVLGTGAEAERIAEMAAPGQHRHFCLVGFVDMQDGGAGAGRLHWQVFPRHILGEPKALHKLVRDRRVDEIVLATRERRANRSGEGGGGLPLEDLLQCKLSGVTVSDYATFWEREAAEIDLESLKPGWMIFSDGFRQSLSRRVVKRLFDVVVSMVFLIATLPITLMTAAAVKLTSRGPVFYRQERVGLNGGRSNC